MTAAHIKTSSDIVRYTWCLGFWEDIIYHHNGRLDLEIKNSYHLLCVMDNEKFTQ